MINKGQEGPQATLPTDLILGVPWAISFKLLVLAPSPPLRSKSNYLRIDLKFVFFLKRALGDSSELDSLENLAPRAVLVSIVGGSLEQDYPGWAN